MEWLLNQNRIGLFLSSNQLIHIVLSKFVHNFLKYHALHRFWPHLSMKNHWRILVSWSRLECSPKLNEFILVTHPTCPLQNPSVTFWDIVVSIVFVLISQWWRITWKFLGSGCGFRFSAKSNQLVLVAHPTCPPSFVGIHPQPLETLCTTCRFSLNGEESLKKILGFEFGSSPQLMSAVLGLSPAYTKNWERLLENCGQKSCDRQTDHHTWQKNFSS